MKYLITLSLLILTSCNSVFYQPNHRVYITPDKLKISYEEFQFASKDGTKLNAWHLKPKTKKIKGTFLQFHGNAENLSSHFISLAWLTQYGYQVVIFDYRGYGKSEGNADRKGVHLDGMSAIDQAIRIHKESKSKGPLVLYGQSLGGNAIVSSFHDHPARSNVDLLILDSTFGSYEDIAFDKLKSFWPTFIFSPLAYLFIDDDYTSEDYLAKLPKIPAIVIHGTNDVAVPFKMGEKVFSQLQGKKEFWRVENGNHIDVYFRKDKDWKGQLLMYLKKM